MMRKKRFAGLWLALALGGAAVANGAAAENGDLMARIHFAGSRHILEGPNAAKLIEIRKLPDNKPFWDEVLQKLSTTPFRVMNRNSTPRKNDHAAELRPLFDDILESESYLEMSDVTNAWPEVSLAIKLDDVRAELWRSVLGAVLADWTGIAVTNVQAGGFKGWELRKHHEPNLFRFVRAGDWVVFGWGQDELRLEAGMLQRIKKMKRPAPELKKNWLEAWLDGPAYAAHHPMSYKLPKMELNVEGRSEFLRPELKLQFAEPLGLRMEPWRIPTNMIYSPVSSITLARGFGPLLSQVPELSNLSSDPLPNQAVMWALPEIPIMMCAAMPVNDARNYLQKIAPGLITLINSKLRESDAAGTAQLTTNMNIAIRGLPTLAPFLRATNDVTGDYLMGGIAAVPPPSDPFPWEPLLGITRPNDVVYYDWELNGERMAQWRMLMQLYFMCKARTLPNLNVPAQNWIMGMKSKLDLCRTVGTLTAPNELTFVRNATVGLTGFELTCLALWVDSPGFPLEDDIAKATAINAGDIRGVR